LYPHHWFRNASVESKLGPAYETVRGLIKLLPATQFETRSTYTGFVPYWPALGRDNPRMSEVIDLLDSDEEPAPPPPKRARANDGGVAIVDAPAKQPARAAAADDKEEGDEDIEFVGITGEARKLSSLSFSRALSCLTDRTRCVTSRTLGTRAATSSSTRTRSTCTS
jgi:hypothetical protein